MAHNLKTLGLALIAVLAMSAVAVSAAQASEPEFHVEEASAIIKGEQVGKNTLTLTGGKVQCSSGTFEGEVSSTTFTELEVSASYGECIGLGLATVWHMNGCKYLGRMVLGSNPPTTVTDIVCPAGKEITITIGKKCVVHIPPQKTIKHIVWDNSGSGKNRDLVATVTEEGIAYTETPGCIFPGTYSNGTYFATETHKAFNKSGSQVGLWAE
jgi:hypothetical protein